MSEHTPGPWEWYWRVQHHYPDGDLADCGVMADVASGRARSICRAPRYENKGQWEANARLIAAAPDLLEAMKELHALIDFDEDISDDKPMVFSDASGINQAMRRARAALARATESAYKAETEPGSGKRADEPA